MRARRADDPEVNLNLRSARRNLLVFSGAGGIGKTRLSSECERSSVRPSGPKAPSRRASALISRSRPRGMPELYLFALRAGLAPVASSLPAFDTCLALYWARRHPGTPMDQFIRNQSLLGASSTATRSLQPPGLRHGLIDGAGGPLVGGARRVAALTWMPSGGCGKCGCWHVSARGWKAARPRRTWTSCGCTCRCCSAGTWRGCSARPTSTCSFCMDTFEHVSHGLRRARPGDLEDAIGRSIFYLPSVLFLLTTRNRLDWAAERRRATLEYAGPLDWPGLAADGRDPDGSDQCRVGELSAVRLRGSPGELPDRRGLRTRDPGWAAAVDRGAVGRLPLYLDVAVHHFRNLVDRGTTRSG